MALYARSAASCPDAKQVADRFHLVKSLNLREAVRRELSVKRSHLAILKPYTPPPVSVEGQSNAGKVAARAAPFKSCAA
jgi:transposase